MGRLAIQSAFQTGQFHTSAKASSDMLFSSLIFQVFQKPGLKQQERDSLFKDRTPVQAYKTFFISSKLNPTLDKNLFHLF